MTDEKKVERPNYNAIIAIKDDLASLAKLSEQRKDNRSEVKMKADKGLLVWAYLHAPKNLKPAKFEDFNPEDAPKAIQYGVRLLEEGGANRLSKSLDSILDKEIPDECLEKIALAEDIKKRASPEHSDVLSAYKVWKEIEDLAKRYDADKRISEDEQKAIVSAAVGGLGDAEAKRLGDEGYSVDVQEAARELAVGAVKHGYLDGKKIKEYAIPGLKAAAKGLAEEYGEKAKEHGKVEDIAREVLRGMAKGQKAEFDRAYDLIYAAAKAK